MHQLRSIGTSIKAIHAGGNEFTGNAFEGGEIKVPVYRVLEHHSVTERSLRVPGPETPGSSENIVGSSERMLEVYKIVARVAPTRSTVLIHGETGTGKELIARAIHCNSPRADRPLVAIDCSALAETLLESELFGHVRGAFTGALTDRRGLFETAHGGTCFLDEIGAISPSMQAKLLRILQEHEVKPVGGTEPRKVDVRVVAATNKDLAQLAADGTFREDLFYRLSVVTIPLPPLRERREDIPPLATHFLHKYSAANGNHVFGISPEAMAMLVEYDWPGNVRQLEHALERAVALTSNPVLLPEDVLPACGSPPPQEKPAGGSPLTLREVVIRHVRSALREAKWNKKLAAQLLGIHRRTLYRLTKRYGIPLRETE